MTETVRPGLRERQRQETHLLIRRAAYELSVERGVAAVSVQEICTTAGISPRTFFNHFRSKDEALVPDFPAFPADVERDFVAAVQPDVVTACEVLLGAHLAQIGEQGAPGAELFALPRLLAANPELLPRALAVFGAIEQRVAALVGQRTGRPADDLRCTVTALAATSAVRAAIMTVTEDTTAGGAALQRALADSFAVLRRLQDPTGPPTTCTVPT